MTESNYIDEILQGDLVLLMNLLDTTSPADTPNVGETAKALVYQENKLKLYQYNQQNVKQKKTPLLIVYALVNRPYITDLEPERSLILKLLETGYPVYLIDWGYPDSTDKFIGLDDYINGYLHRCVKQVHRHSGVNKIDMLGICQGGVLSLCYSAMQPTSIRKLVTLVTPVDFHVEGNILSRWVANLDLSLIHNNKGNISGGLLVQLFKTMKPYLLNRSKYRNISKKVHTQKKLDTFLRMEKWLNDCPDLAGKMAIEFVEKFYQANAFENGDFSIGSKTINLKNINCPTLNLYAARDHIVPPASSKALGKYIKKTLYTEVELEGGHIGTFTSLTSQKKLIKTLTNWLK